MNAIDFVIRTRTGATERGSVAGENQGFLINAGSGNDISINIRQSDLRGYDRAADDLLITLADGRVVVLEGYFAEGEGNRLFLSADGTLNQVSFVEADGGALYAQYGPTETWGKWSPSDDLIFLDDPMVVAEGAYAGDDEVSMLGTALLGGAAGLGGLGAAGVGLVGLGLLGLTGGDGDGGDGGGVDGGTTPAVPTVDNPEADIDIGGGDDPKLEITGTGEPGDDVSITVDEDTVTTVIDEDGTWEVVFEGDDFPADGIYEDVVVVVTHPDGSTTELDGPSFEIDTTPPALEVQDGTVSLGDLFNTEGYEESGVSVSGTAEVGATVVMVVGDHTQTVVVGESGTWSFSFDEVTFPAGEYTTDITITATDSFGNATVVSDSVQVDTIGLVSLDNAPLTGDDLIGQGEYDAGVTLSGMSQAGSSVVVTVEGVSHTVTAGGTGSWSVTFAAGELPEGTYTTSATIVATDAAGNVVSTSHSFDVDTEISLAINTSTVGGDGTVNAGERAAGVVLTGTAEAGSSVVVMVAGTELTASVAANGSWSVNIPAGLIPEGETSLAVSAISTDAAGNSATATGNLDVDTQVRNFTNTSMPGGADGVLNAQEASQGLTLTGTTEPGGTVMVTLDGVAKPATVDASGNWSVTYSSDQLPSGERTVSLVAVSTDAAGNTESLTQSVRVDTEAGILTISPAPVEGDDIVNFAEASDGVVLTGTSNPFETVTVTMNGVSHTVQTGANGVWKAPFASSEVAPGTYTAEITATITDNAGNSLLRTDTVRVDTEVENFAPSSTPIETDGVINKVEASNGVTLTGTTEVGASVQVVFEGMSYTGVVDSAGNWTVNLPASAMLSGETSGNAKILTTDHAGNTAETAVTLTFDTVVNVLNMSDAPITADNVVNAAEAAEGITLNGQVEAGSTVMVTFGGMVHEATVNSAGQWSLDIPPSSIPAGTRNETMLIQATDAAGNIASITETIAIDTDAPGALAWEGYGRNHSGVDEIRTEITGDTVEIGVVVNPDSSPAVVDVALDSSVDVGVLGVTYHSFTAAVPDGSHLVVTATDAAGNMSGNYLVTDDPATNEVTMTDSLANVLSDYQIESIDLEFAEDSHLTITEAQITALSTNTDTIVVHGGADDSVTIIGATQTGTTIVDGETFNTFSLGDATLLIDDDITNINGLV